MAIISNGTTVVSGGGLSISVTPPTSLGAIGTYGYFYTLAMNNLEDPPAITYSGSNLDWSNSTGSQYGQHSRPSGTWRLMGATSQNNTGTRASLYVRIS